MTKAPIVGSFPGCCARAASGHVAAAPPRRVMNSRRFTASGSPVLDRKIAYGGGLLHRGIFDPALSALGQTRSFGDVGSMSGLLESGHAWATYESKDGAPPGKRT